MIPLASRRQLLRLAAALPMGLPVFALSGAVNRTALSCHLVRNQMAGTGVLAGTLVLADASIHDFRGDGYYLYPDWGTPVVYKVRAHQGRLAFHYPGVEKSLWTMTASAGARLFAGRLEGIVGQVAPDADIATLVETNHLRKLSVPALPVA